MAISEKIRAASNLHIETEKLRGALSWYRDESGSERLNDILENITKGLEACSEYFAELNKELNGEA